MKGVVESKISCVTLGMMGGLSLTAMFSCALDGQAWGAVVFTVLSCVALLMSLLEVGKRHKEEKP